MPSEEPGLLEGMASGAAAIIDFAEGNLGHEITTLDGDGRGVQPVVAVLPSGRLVQDLRPMFDAWLERPRRVEGIAKHQTLESFIEHVNRFKQPESAIFGNRVMPGATLLAVIDYHNPARLGLAEAEGDAVGGNDIVPAWCAHTVLYPMPVSEEWSAWTKANGAKLDQMAFALLIEERLADVVVVGDGASPTVDMMVKQLGVKMGTPAELVQFSRGLKVNVGGEVGDEVNPSSGEVSLTFTKTHRSKSGGELAVPGAFVLSIPVFEDGTRYLVVARLRYRIDEAVTWWVDLYRPDVVFRAAFNEAANTAHENTGLPLYLGKPESR